MPLKTYINTAPNYVWLGRQGWDSYGTYYDSTIVLESGVGIVDTLTFDSVNTPGYKTKKKYGDLPINNLFQRSVKYSGGEFSAEKFFDNHYGGLFVGYTGVLNKNDDWGTHPVIDPYELSNELLGKVKGQVWNSPVALAEMDQTAKLIYDSARRIASGYRSLRKGDFLSFAETFGIRRDAYRNKRYHRDFGKNPKDAASNAWLEYSYGWRPLLGDIHSAAATLADRLHAPRGQSTTVQVTKRFNETKNWDNLHIPMPVPTYVDAVHSMQGAATLSVTFDRDYAATAATAVGITNPALVAWELVPFSFVADWFLPVGDFLNTFDATDGVKFRHGYSLIKRTDVLRYKGRKMNNIDLQVTGTREYYSKIRTKLVTFPAPVLPKPRLPTSVGQALSAISLLYQRFKGR